MALPDGLEDVLRVLREQPLVVPDELTQHYIRRGGSDSSDTAMTRLISLAAQKFMEDIIRDTLQAAKTRRQMPEKRLREAGYNPRDKRLVLSPDDLAQTLKEYGVNLRTPPYFVDRRAGGGGAAAAPGGAAQRPPGGP